MPAHPHEMRALHTVTCVVCGTVAPAKSPLRQTCQSDACVEEAQRRRNRARKLAAKLK